MQNNELNLKIVERNDNFNDWMYSEIKPFIKGDILEVGSGLGVFSRRIIKGFSSKDNKIILSEINSVYLKNLEHNFQSKKVQVIKLNLGREKDFSDLQKQGQKKQKFDTIICLNVLEHVQDDILALKNLQKILKPKGRIILLVPAHKFLFNSVDRAVLHFRRYTKKELRTKTSKVKLQTKKMFYFNMFAILGWFVNGNIFKKKILSSSAFSLFNKLVPLFRFIENKLLFRATGLSIIAILKNNE